MGRQATNCPVCEMRPAATQILSGHGESTTRTVPTLDRDQGVAQRSRDAFHAVLRDREMVAGARRLDHDLPGVAAAVGADGETGDRGE